MFKDLFVREGYVLDHCYDWTFEEIVGTGHKAKPKGKKILKKNQRSVFQPLPLDDRIGAEHEQDDKNRTDGKSGGKNERKSGGSGRKKSSSSNGSPIRKVQKSDSVQALRSPLNHPSVANDKQQKYRGDVTEKMNKTDATSLGQADSTDWKGQRTPSPKKKAGGRWTNGKSSGSGKPYF